MTAAEDRVESKGEYVQAIPAMGGQVLNLGELGHGTGMVQKVAFARCIAEDPNLLLRPGAVE